MSRQNQQGGLTYPHFALIYIDRDGNLRQELSRSVAHSSQTILSPQVTKEFLSAVARSGYDSSHSPLELCVQIPTHRIPPIGQTSMPHQMANTICGVDIHGVEGPINLQPGPPIRPASWLGQQEPWAREHQQLRTKPWNEKLSPSSPKTMISIKDEDFLRGYYEKGFQNLQQTNCRIIAKAYVKLVEPRKQINYPYNGRKVVAGRIQQFDPDMTKPPWWPAGVRHREPDHLLKTERIRLLVYILCELRTSNGITSQRLREADQPIRCQIFPAERLQILDELYVVRRAEEKFLEGTADEKTLVSVSRGNLPDAVGFAVGEGEYSRKITLAEDGSSRCPGQKRRSIRSRSVRNRSTQQPALMLAAEKPTSLFPNSDSAAQIPSQHIQQDLAIYPSFNHVSASMSTSPQDLSGKHRFLETHQHTTFCTDSIPCNSPFFVGFQPFLPETYDGLQGFQQPEVPNTREPGAEQLRRNMESYGFTYYSEDWIC